MSGCGGGSPGDTPILDWIFGKDPGHTINNGRKIGMSRKCVNTNCDAYDRQCLDNCGQYKYPRETCKEFIDDGPIKEKMIKRMSWKEFQDSGMLWWVNRLLHTFGLAIVLEEENGKITDVYPSKCKFRGFARNAEEDGFKAVSNYIDSNAARIKREAHDE